MYYLLLYWDIWFQDNSQKLVSNCDHYGRPIQCLDLSNSILYVFTFNILFNVSISVLWHVYRVYIMMDRARYHGIYQEIWENLGSILSNISHHFVAKNGRSRNRQDLTKSLIFTTVKYFEWIELDKVVCATIWSFKVQIFGFL